MTWRPETALERMAEARAAMPAPRRPEAWARRFAGHEAVPNPPLRCSCGRTVPADMLTWIPPGVRAAFDGREWACDACRERAHLGGRITREAFLAACGAPPEVLAKARRKDSPQTGD